MNECEETKSNKNVSVSVFAHPVQYNHMRSPLSGVFSMCMDSQNLRKSYLKKNSTHSTVLC